MLGRTEGLQFRLRRAAPFLRNLISGQQWMRVIKGTGKVLVRSTPAGNAQMFQAVTGEADRGPAID